MNNGIELIPIVFDVVLFAGLFCLACTPIVQKRTRARWATSVLVGGGIVGALVHAFSLLLRFHCLTLGHRGDVASEMVVSDIDHVILGLIVALIMSGELIGKKESAIMGNEPAT